MWFHCGFAREEEKVPNYRPLDQADVIRSGKLPAECLTVRIPSSVTGEVDVQLSTGTALSRAGTTLFVR